MSLLHPTGVGNNTWQRRDHRRGNRIEQLPYGWETFKHLVKYDMRFFCANRATGSGDDDMTGRYVVTAEFAPTREIRLIDLTNLPPLPSRPRPPGSSWTPPPSRQAG